MNSASLCSLAGRYNNPIPIQCLAPIDFLKIPALDLLNCTRNKTRRTFLLGFEQAAWSGKRPKLNLVLTSSPMDSRSSTS